MKQCIFITTIDELSLEQWKAKGRPFTLLEVERDEKYIVYIDTAYGHLFLYTINGEEVTHSKDVIIHDNIVVLDKDYFGVSKYIWK